MKRHMNLQTKQKIKRIAALLLSFVLMFDALEISAPAPVVRAQESGFNAFCAVTAFAQLPQGTREQTLPIGAQESDIELPKSLSATASMLADPADLQAGGTEAADGAQGAALAEMGNVLPAEELPIIDGEAQPQPQSQTEAAAPAAAGAEDLGLTIDSIDEIPYQQNMITIDGVKWRIDEARSDADEFLSDEAHEDAVYTYTAVLPEKDSKGRTILLQDTARLPEITVTVHGRKTETEALTDAQSEAETEELTEVETEIETEEEADAETETGSAQLVESEEESESEKDAETERETEAAQNEIEKDTEEEKLTEAQTEHVTEEPQTEIEKTTETEKVTEGQSESETEEFTEAKSETEEITEAQAKTGELAEDQAETEIETEAETETEELTEAESETETEEELTETESETETEEQIDVETEIETETDAETETGSDKAMEETESESETELTVEEDTETETEAVAESETEEPTFGLMSLGDELGGPMTIDETETNKEITPVYNEDGSLDLTPYIDSVEFTWTDSNGIQWPIEEKNGKYEFPADHTLGFTLNYHIPAGAVTREKNVVTYRLPENFSYTDTDGIITWGSENAGTYTIKDGVVTLTFDKNSKFFDTDTDFTGYVTFESDLKKESSSSSGNMKFKDDVEFTYTITDKKEDGTSATDSSFMVGKEGAWVDGKTLNYKLTVTPGANGATNVTFKDKLGVYINNDYTDGFEFDSIEVVDAFNQKLQQLTLSSLHDPEVLTEDKDDGQKITTEIYKDSEGKELCRKVRTEEADGTVSEIVTPSEGYYIVEGPQSDGSYIFHLPDMADKDKQYIITYTADVSSKFTERGFDPNWGTLNANNKVSDSQNRTKADIWTYYASTWIQKYNSGTTLDGGAYKTGWTIDINPNHLNMPLDMVFSDSITVPAGIEWENGGLSIILTDKDGNVVDTISVTDEDLLSKLMPENGKTTTDGIKIYDLLQSLGELPDGSNETDTTDYKITINYTTTVEKSSLPNGYTSLTNAGKITEGTHEAGASAPAGMQNDVLKKEVDYNGVTVGTASYTDGGEEKTAEVLEIPWNVTVKMDDGLTDNSTGKTVNASVQDFFGKKLWATPEYLLNENNLTINVYEEDGTFIKTLGRDSYTLTYKKTATDGEYQESAAVGEKTRIAGFQVTFKEIAYADIQGKKLVLSYKLYGDTDFLHEPVNDGQRNSWTYINTAEYGGGSAEASYTKSGDYFAKESSNDSNWYDATDKTLDLDKLTDNRIAWRVKTKLDDTSLGKDITITDTLPASLELYSVSVERNDRYQGYTAPLTEITIPYTYELDFYANHYSDQIIEGVKIEIEITKDSSNNTIIRVTIPGSLVQAGDNKNCFNLNIEAEIPKDSEIRDPAKLTTETWSFTNKANLQIGSDPRGEDSNTVTVKNKKSVLEKDGIYTEAGDARIMHYTLLANPDGTTRDENGDGTLTVEDTLVYEPDIVSADGKVQPEAKVISLVPGSVKAYYYEDGKKVDLYDFSYQYEETDLTQTEGNIPGTRQNKLTMTIPDGKAVYIEYDYELQSSQKELSWKITNTATLEGKKDWSDEDDRIVEFQSSSAGVKKDFVNFYKVDSTNYNIMLPGAEFVLYEWKPYDGEWTKAAADAAKQAAEADHPGSDIALYVIPEGNDGCWVARHDTASGEILTFVSDSAGLLPIGSLQTGVYYWLKETKAPVGYQIADNYGMSGGAAGTAENGYYFYLVSKSEAPALPTGLAKEQIHEMSGANTVYIPNTPTGSGVIEARKVWADGIKSVNIEVSLYKSNSRGCTYADVATGKLTFVGTREITAGSEIVTWNNLQTSDEGGAIYYYVFETKVGEAGNTPIFLGDGSCYIDGYGVDYSYNRGLKAGTVVITNRRTSISAKKVWAGGTTPEKVGFVEFSLYQSTVEGLTNKDFAELFDTLGDPGVSAKLKPVFDKSTGTPLKKEIKYDDPNQEVSWNNLPVADEEGNPLYYYVLETKVGTDGTPSIVGDVGDAYMVGNFAVTYDKNGIQGGMITVTNDATQIEVQKVWKDVDEQNVTMQLYQSFTKPKPGAPEEEKEVEVHIRKYSEDNTEDPAEEIPINPPTWKTTSDTLRLTWIWKGSSASADKMIKIRSISCDREDVHVELISSVMGAGSNQWTGDLRTVFTVSGLTDSCKLYIDVENVTGTYNNDLAGVDLPSQVSGLQLPDATPVELPDGEGKVTLNAGNEWYHVWKNLPKVALDESDGLVKPVYYYVKEENRGKYSQEYSYEYNKDGSLKLVTVTNKPEKPTETSITVEKKWLDFEGKVREPDSGWTVNLQLYQKQSDGSWAAYTDNGKITLPLGNEWSYTWEKLPIGEYYVAEENGEGNPVDERFDIFYKQGTLDDPTSSSWTDPTTDPETNANAQKVTAEGGTITVINKEKTTEIEVEKLWEKDSKRIEPKTDWQVQMQLYSSTTKPVKEPTTTETSITVTVDSWVKDGVPTEYAPSSGGINVKIYKCDDRGEKTDETPVFEGTLGPDSWSITTGKLPGVTTGPFDAVEVHHYKVVYEKGDGIDSVEFTGSDKTGIVAGDNPAGKTVGLTASYRKSKLIDWGVFVGEYERPHKTAIVSTDEVIVKLVMNTHEFVDETSLCDSTLEISDKRVSYGSPYQEILQMDWGDEYVYLCYKLQNVQEAEDDTITVTFHKGTALGDITIWGADYLEIIPVSTEPTPTAISTFSTHTASRNGNANMISGIPYRLNGPDGSEVDAELVGDPVTLTNGKWSYKWENLPQYDSAGNKLYYYVEEKLVSDSNNPEIKSTTYEYEYFNDAEPWEGIKKVTVTNTLPGTPEPTKTSVQVTKNWVGYEGDEESNYSVEVELWSQSREVTTGTASTEDGWGGWSKQGGSVWLKKYPDNWQHVWSNLPEKVYSSEDKWTEYRYEVKEVQVLGPPDSGTSGASSGGNVEIKNFDTTYVQDGNNWTITNTKKRQGITLPGTGSKYPWIFYGIGMTFMLIALVWMRRALKKSYIPSDTGKGGRRSDE